jgi:hypothetical protein
VRASVAAAEPVGHDGGAHWVPAACSWQRPAPSQNPVRPQVAAPSPVHTPFGSVPFAGIARQTPGVPTSAHDMQLAVQSVVQQTPWLQNPLLQSAGLAQLAPGGRSPHDPLSQTFGDAQSASAVQLDLHAATPHR